VSNASSTITVGNRVEELARIYAALDEFAERSRLPEAARRALLLVVEELFTNIVGHGYRADAADSVVLTVERDSQGLILTLRDRGTAFDVAQPPKRPDEDLALDDMPVGGLGLFLVHEFARSVTNRRDGNLNVTEVRLPVDEAEAI